MGATNCFSGPAPAQTEFDGTEASSATRQVISNSMLSIGWDKLLHGKHGCINFGRDMLLQDWYSVLPKEYTIIELTEDVESDAEVVAGGTRHARSRGIESRWTISGPVLAWIP